MKIARKTSCLNSGQSRYFIENLGRLNIYMLMTAVVVRLRYCRTPGSGCFVNISNLNISNMPVFLSKKFEKLLQLLSLFQKKKISVFGYKALKHLAS